MKTVLITLSLIVSNFLASAQSPKLERGKTYSIFRDLALYQVNSIGIDRSRTYNLCKNNRVEISQITATEYLVTIKSFKFIPPCVLEVDNAHTYGIAFKDLEEALVPQKLFIAFSAITVPFKYEFKSSKIYGGGTIGGGIGVRHINGLMLSLNGGYSRIPLNNLSSTTNPENVNEVGALTWGVTGGYAIGRFQGAVIWGNDLYNVNDQKQSKSWLSIAFGFNILKDPNEK
jgi:hypothetical protein